MHIDIPKFWDAMLPCYIALIWLGLLTLNAVFFLAGAALVTAYGIGRTVTYPQAQDNA